MKTKFLLLIFLFILFDCNTDIDKKQLKPLEDTHTKDVLLIGTFHYNNPGADVAKTKSFDILSQSSQEELKRMSFQIKKYNPSKIFVEWPYDEQEELDSLYQLYLKEQYFTKDNLSEFYLKNEIFQLAFRVAKDNNLKKVHAIDYTTSFPFDDVLLDIEHNNQTELKTKIESGIAKFTEEFDDKIDAGASLLELTYYLNSLDMRYFSNHFHNNLMLLAGSETDFNGPLLTSEWYKRNLYMWSLIQKKTDETDKRIMVLAGASHVAMFQLFVKENKDWNVMELQDVILGNFLN